MSFDLFKTLGLKTVQQTLQGVGHSIDQAIRPVEPELLMLGIDAATGLPLGAGAAGGGVSPAMSLSAAPSLLSGDTQGASLSGLTAGLGADVATFTQAIEQLPNGLAIGLQNTIERERGIVLADTANLGIYILIFLVGMVALWALLAPSPETIIETAAKIAPVVEDS